jgi:hypothetical protein
MSNETQPLIALNANASSLIKTDALIVPGVRKSEESHSAEGESRRHDPQHL